MLLLVPAHHWMPHDLLPAGEDPGQREEPIDKKNYKDGETPQ